MSEATMEVDGMAEVNLTVPAGSIRLSDIVNVDVVIDSVMPQTHMSVDYGGFRIEDAYIHYAQSSSWSPARRLFVERDEVLEKVDAPSRTALLFAPAVDSAVDLTEPRRALALEAEELLGYKPLLKDAGVPSKLQRVLAELEIDHLDQKAVDAYKAQMVQHYASHQKMVEPTWRLTELGEYRQPVPEYVLRKACQIKKALPQAQFYIDQLAVDPFLIVTLSELDDPWTNQPSRDLDATTAMYIEVWDEPKFEDGVE